MSTIRVHTTQNVSLEYAIASVGDRILATFIDYLLYGVWFLFAIFLNFQLKLDTVFLFLLFLPTVFYHLVCEVYFNGQSLGKKARHIRVMRLDGTAPSLGDYLLRWLLRPVEVLLFWGGPALFTILLNGKGQRLGDLAAGTTVISLKPRANELLVAEAAMPEGYQPVFPQAAQLSDHDTALLRQLLSRSLAQDNYLLLNETATKVKSLLNLQTDLGDEPFLRTILRDHAYLLSVDEAPR